MLLTCNSVVAEALQGAKCGWMGADRVMSSGSQHTTDNALCLCYICKSTYMLMKPTAPDQAQYTGTLWSPSSLHLRH